MASPARLSETDVQSAVAQLHGWTVVHGKLHREYTFPDFAHAVGFIAMCAPAIEKMNHHPEWFNVYSRVVVDLTTHDAGGITIRDIELAKKLEAIATKLI